MTEALGGNEAALQKRVAELEAAVGLRSGSAVNVLRLSPAMNKLLGMLLATEYVTADMINTDLDIASDAKVAIHRLRRAIKPWDFTIKSRRFVGYWLDDETKAAITRLVTPQVTVGQTNDETKNGVKLHEHTPNHPYAGR